MLRIRDNLRIEGLSLLRKDIDWKKVKNPTHADVYVLPSASLRRNLIAAILQGAELFVAKHPKVFKEAANVWLKDEVGYIEENLGEAEERFANVSEALARMKAFTQSPDKSDSLQREQVESLTGKHSGLGADGFGCSPFFNRLPRVWSKNGRNL